MTDAGPYNAVGGAPRDNAQCAGLEKFTRPEFTGAGPAHIATPIPPAPQGCAVHHATHAEEKSRARNCSYP